VESDALKHIECIYSLLTSDVLDHLKVGVVVLDGDLKVKWANHFLIHDLCGQNDHVVGMDLCQILSSVSGSGVSSGYSNVTDQLCKGEKIFLHIPPKKGAVHRWLEHRLYPIDSDIYNEGWVGYFYDITGQIKYNDPVAFFEKQEPISFDTSLCERSECYPLSPSASIKKYTDLLLDGEVNEERRTNTCDRSDTSKF